MAHHTPEEVVALAQRRVVERAAHSKRQQLGLDMRWRYAFGGLFVVLAVALIAWPGLPLQWKLYVAVHGVCAQVHNVTLGDCTCSSARNTGIYSAGTPRHRRPDRHGCCTSAAWDAPLRGGGLAAQPLVAAASARRSPDERINRLGKRGTVAEDEAVFRRPRRQLHVR